MALATGYIPRDYTAQPLGSIAECKAFSLPPIPKEEWPDRIDYLREQKARLTDVADLHGIKGSDQGPLPYCWMHGAMNSCRILRAKARLPYKELSATAAAAQIMNFRQKGGNTFDGIPWLVKNGIPETKYWPERSLDRKYLTPEMTANALENKLTEWDEMEPNDMEQKATALLNGFPVCAGYMHWGHMISDFDLIYRKRGNSYEFGVESLNSHGPTWGEFGNGRVQLWGSKAVSFDQAMLRVVRA